MKLPVIRLLQKVFSKFNLFEFILPMLSISIGIGIVFRSSFKIEVSLLIQMILFLTFLEIGSQVFLFHCQELAVAVPNSKFPGERNASLILAILFYGLSILPFSQILQDSKVSPASLVLLAISSFILIIWRNIEESAINQIIRIFLISFNYSFLIPLTQLVFFRLNVNLLFITISQVLFLFLLGFMVLREIVRIEIKKEKSRIVQVIGTIPLLRIVNVILIIGSGLLGIYLLRNPRTEVIVHVFLTFGFLFLLLNQTSHLNRNGKNGLITLYRITSALLVAQFAGWLLLLWTL
ncbi:MAG: hypothetical protein FJZ98_05370 [Chloroflexi bacterium]|nr:hypothetical protein [Chloroflexota bacterium]